jgi:hypothetical protein
MITVSEGTAYREVFMEVETFISAYSICGPHGLPADFGEENIRDPTAQISALHFIGYSLYTVTVNKHINMFKSTSKISTT